VTGLKSAGITLRRSLLNQPAPSALDMMTMTKLSTRASLFGLLTLVFAGLSAAVCVLLAFGAMGLGTWVALAEGGSFGGGAAIGALGVFAAFVGLVFSAVQGFARVLIMRGRTLGMVLGFLFAGLAVMTGLGGAWMSLAYGAFGLWALWTSREQFQ
jgi:hypothetical protein